MEIKIKWGLGTIIRTRKPIKLYHVVVNGLTLSSHTTERDAKAWAYDYMKKHTTKTHDIDVQ
jgi:hypothetical protein